MSEAITHKLPLKHELAKHIADVLISSPADGQVLTYEAASQKWKNKAPTGQVLHKCRLYRAANQSIPNATNTWVDWTDEDFDPFNMHSGTDYFITIQQAGYYLLFAQGYFASNATGRRWIRIRKNTVFLGAMILTAVSGDYTAFTAIVFGYFNVGDTADVVVFQNSGAALDFIGTYQGSSFNVFQLP